MKNILKQIKQTFFDNKEYFIRCTIMTLISGLILGISISLVVPASAADEPTEGDQIIIPAGSYRFNNQLTDYPIEGGFDYSLVGMCYAYVITGESSISIEQVPFTSFYCGVANLDDGLGTLPIFYFSPETDTYMPSTYGKNRDGWLLYYYAFQNIGYSVVGDISLLQDFTVTSDTSVDSVFATWFFANTTTVGDVDPDPEYTIPAGWYLWQEELLGEFIPHTLTFNYRTFQRVGASGIPYYSYWSSMHYDNYVENDSYFSRLYYSSISNGRVLVYDNINGGWVDETYRRFYISSPLTLSAEDYFIFNAYTEYHGDTPPSFPGETVPSVPDPDSNIFTNIIGGVLDALDAFTIFGGFSLLDLLTTLLGGMALVWILKLLAGG